MVRQLELIAPASWDPVSWRVQIAERKEYKSPVHIGRHKDDAAMNKGGIDLNGDRMKIDVRGSSGVPASLPDVVDMDVDGFSPVIRGIRPIDASIIPVWAEFKRS
jgi:hypothetical protein